MKTRNLLPLLLAGSMIVACGESMDSDAPLDAENGLETLDSKDDSFAVRPGSPEAEAVVAFANQALADNAAGAAFRDLLDSEMHKTAAKNVAKYRAGADGNFGTADDQIFADLTALDKVPYVGRSALMQMLGLADAAGYMNRASVDCADFIAPNRDDFNIRSYAALLELENSHCSIINGNLNIQISGTDILPPSAREIQLKHLESVTGDINIYATPIFNSINFKSLKSVNGSLTARYNNYASAMHTLEFPALTSAPDITLRGMKKTTFGKLESGRQITLDNTDMTGFTALKAAENLQLQVNTRATYDVQFPVLATADKIQFTYTASHYSYIRQALFRGEFPKLTTVNTLLMNDGAYTNLKYPALKTIVTTFNSSNTLDPFNGLEKLQQVGHLNSQSDHFTAGSITGPKNLTTAGQISLVSEAPVIGFDKVKTVESKISINANRGITGFNALEVAGGHITLSMGGTLKGFNALTNAKGLTLNGQYDSVTIEPSFGALENIESSLSVIQNRAFDTDIQFPELLSVAGNVQIDNVQGKRDSFPTLEIIDGSLVMNIAPTTFIGMDKLTHIEGNFSIGGALTTMNGLSTLNSIGGNLLVARGFNGANLDAFINQLTEFSGTINFRN